MTATWPRWVLGPLAIAASTAYALGGVQEGSAQEGRDQAETVRWDRLPLVIDPCPDNRTEVDPQGVARVWSGDRLCAELPPGIVHLRGANLDSFGVNEAGGPNAFLEPDGSLRVNCDAPTIRCDDEGS